MGSSSIERGIRMSWMAAFVLMALSLLPGSIAFAPAAHAAVVSRIDVQGNQRVDATTVRAYVLVQPGRSYSAADLDESVKSLFETGLFSDVQIRQQGNVLVVTVVESPVINEVAFEGNKKFKDDQLKTIVATKPRGVFTRAAAQSDVSRILELYRRGGRFQASVTPQTIELPNNRVNVVFQIAEGPRTGVSGLNFIGNQAFGDRRLRTVIETRQTGLLSFLRSGGTYDPDRLSSDEDKLRRFYLDRGYADFQIVSSVADLDRERNSFFITFTFDEGPRYRFGQVAVDSSVPGVNGADLERQVITDPGDVYSADAISKSIERITMHLAAAGYPFIQVRPRIDRNPETLTIGVTYVVDEGARTYVERIEVRGNTRTRDYVIRREIELAEGDAFNPVLIDRAERRLRNLGYFSEVRVGTEPGSSPDRVVLVVSVTEEPTGEFSFGVGYSTSEGIIGDLSLTERNFLGRGYTLRLAVGGSESSRNYEFGFTDPYFLGRRISAGVAVFRREYDATSSRAYDYDSTGGAITFGFPITENFAIQTGYQLQVQDIGVRADQCDYDFANPSNPSNLNNVSPAICRQAGESIVSSVLYSLVYDSLDNRKDPRSGIYAKFTQEFAGVGGDVSFLRTTGSAAYYQELLADADVIGFLKVQGGHIVGIGENVRLTDAFFKGGETVRGFESSGFGPRDLGTGDALGGNIFVAGTAEVQFPAPVLPRELGLKGAVFADAGTLFSTDYVRSDVIGTLADEAALRSSVGGSILWASPIGPLRADFAQVLTSESYDKEQFFRFGGGTRF